MTMLQDLLRFTPEYWDTDPQGVGVMTITYAGTACWVNIQDDVMEIVPEGGNGKRHTIPLDAMFSDALTQIPYLMRLSDLQNIINHTIPAGTGYDTSLITPIPAAEGYHAELIDANFQYFTDGTVRPPDLNNIWRQRPIIYTNVPLPSHTPPLTEAERWPVVAAKPGRPQPNVGPYKSFGWYLNEPETNRPLMIPGFGNGIADICAAILVDGLYNVVEINTLPGTTSLIWQLLKPLARTLRKAQEYGSDLTRQIDLRSVEGPWLDRWGAVYGIKRIYPETDSDFRRRLSATVLQPRISPTSIERAVKYGLSFLDVQVDDVPGFPFRFKVVAIAPPDRSFYIYPAVQNIIESYRAAGTYYDFSGAVRNKETIVAPHWAVKADLLFTSGATQTWYAGNAVPDGVLTGWRQIASSSLTIGTDQSLWGGDLIGGQLFG